MKTASTSFRPSEVRALVQMFRALEFSSTMRDLLRRSDAQDLLRVRAEFLRMQERLEGVE